MLKLQQITKDYRVADTTVHALKGVDLAFRKSEFVSILGPSGCGKTTLLNIIGGLDHYTSGELFINGVSTVRYDDRDWDNYRNHKIGFVFQSYNLIPHQTISENVELALSISGIDKAERVRRAHEALDKVGLKNQYNKKPNQLSGGQCQRVAIARAIVNEPEILLADEPTGALDTSTSVQIMDIIKEIAAERLVIMVTHNPDIAKQYSTRIINLLDGEVQHDSDPYNGDEEQVAEEPTEAEVNVEAPSDAAVKKPKRKKQKKSKLSAWGAFKLSARNLWSKFKRTALVCVAGSIGIVGVATVLAVSSGVKGYIAGMQDDMLSGNPITISSSALDTGALMAVSDNFMSTGNSLQESVKDGYVNVNMMIEYLVSRGNDMSSLFVQNNITQQYVDYVDAMPKEYYNAIVKYYGLNLSNNLYTDYKLQGGDQQLSLTAATEIYTSMLENTQYSFYSQFVSTFSSSFSVVPNNPEYIMSQYDFLGEGGKIATEANEIMIVVSDDTTLTDLMLAQYGYYSQEQFLSLISKAVGDDYDEDLYKTQFSYEELLGKTFTWYPNDTVFNKNTNPITSQTSPFTYNANAQDGWKDGEHIDLTITAILKPKATISYGCLSNGFYYTDALAQHILQSGKNSQIAEYLRNAENQSCLSTVATHKTSGFKLYSGITYDYTFYMNKLNPETQQMEEKEFNNKGVVGSQGSGLDMLLGMLNVPTASEYTTKSYTLSLRNVGGNDLASSIAVYPLSFDDKDLVTDYLNAWNGDGDVVINGVTVPKKDVVNEDGDVVTKGRSDIMYTDNLELVINIINQFIDIITTALIAFTALSLLVSTVMIAIITYVSVIERIKEIGVIRSLGGRKRDVSNLFIAETFIIGGISGVFGILVTYGISALLNAILGSLFDIYTIAALPFWQALVMIGVSIVLTLISGLIPASIAAKKDPVESLRSE
ncbi:MAG: ABC transporter ATP-binding protein/permease [Firmicutes bacterium]|nr:ABC transporter ATP-binding protein/permease [Bacillota bacterium]